MVLLRQRPGLTDRQIREATGIEPHQQVNQITNRLARQGRIRRVREAALLRNYPRDEPSPGAPASPAQSSGAQAREGTSRRATPPSGRWRVEPLAVGHPLLVLPCSARKARGGGPVADGESVLDHLPAGLAEELARARSRLAACREREEQLLPAWRRYTGHLYQAATSAWGALHQQGVPVAIVSGGYGVVLSTEPIAWYDARFRPSDWPSRLVPRSLAALAQTLNVDRVVALAGASTAYARVMRQAPWPVPAALLTPRPGGGGAMRATPRLLGLALSDLPSQPLDETWHGDGLSLDPERLR